jgi:tight adherence protein C
MLTALLGFDPRLLVWPLLLGLGLLLFLTGQPLGRPKPDLGEWLRRYDSAARLRAELARPARPPLFDSPLLEGLLRPLLEDAAGLVQRLGRRLGLGDPAALERKLALLEPELGLLDWYARKVGAGVIGLAVGPLTLLLGSGWLPPWSWPLGFAAGFFGLDAWLDSRWRARQTRLLLELDAVLELIGIAMAAGLGVEQAVQEAARAGRGELAGELRLVSGTVALGGRSLAEAFEALARRSDLVALWRLASALAAATEQGLPLTEALAAQVDALREAKRVRLVAEGGRATTRMLLPIVPAILVVLLIIIGAPAGQVLLGLGQ